MNKIILNLLAVGLLFSSTSYYGSTTAPVVIAGGIIKARHSADETTKYKRKDCPICNGKGWYMSGDGIKKIDCNYCEPDNKGLGLTNVGPIKSINPSTKSNYPNCPNGVCPLPNNKR